MYTTNAVVISNTVNAGTGDNLRAAFGKLNTSLQALGTYVYSLTAIDYLTANTVLTLADGQTTLAGDFVPSASLSFDLGTAGTVWNQLYVGVISTTDLTVTGTLAAFADGGSF